VVGYVIAVDDPMDATTRIPDIVVHSAEYNRAVATAVEFRGDGELAAN
jgi:hypothetical protein